MERQKNLTIIIVTFESSQIIENCLKGINYEKYEVFVVDNNSQDDTVKIVKKNFPKAHLIELDQNIGYGRANNMALRNTKTDYALILNPDASMSEENIENAIHIMDKNPDFALASPKVFHTKDLTENEETSMKSKNLKEEDKFIISDFIVGGVMFMRMSVFQKIGFFDENIFMFSEDNEISQRSINSGYKNITINNSVAFHSGAGSSKKTLRTTYRRFWHLGWSKSYWKSRRKGWINLKRSTLRLILVYLFEALLNIFKLNIEKVVSKFAFAMGCLAHFIGLGAFNKKDKARG